MNNSSITIGKTKNTETTFNFKFDNGLLVKPIIECESSVGYSEEYKSYVLSVYINNNEDILALNNFIISSFVVFLEKRELWLSIEDYYLVFNIDNDIILNKAKNKELIFYFFNKKKEFLKGVNIGNKISLS